MGDVCISINLSAVQLRKPGLLETLKTNLARYEVPPHMLELELTETILMDSVETTIEQLVGFKGIGVQLSIDDFGTGYSSLNYLKRFPIDKLKIDRSFVHAMLADSARAGDHQGDHRPGPYPRACRWLPKASSRRTKHAPCARRNATNCRAICSRGRSRRPS